MPKFAILNNNVVENVIICDNLQEAQTVGDAVQCESMSQSVGTNWIYNSETHIFTNPAEDTDA